MNKRHLWLMVLCCLAPLVGLAAILLFKIPASTVIYIALLLLCPLLHFLMMGQMRHEPGGDFHNHDHQAKIAEKR